ncbi:MAG TPA: DUF308 domain-containing protein [Candidatus Acidoferrum sp.]|nr:DUF308 domain-containing protein [Candidatus Acidoferrum sp.]
MVQALASRWWIFLIRGLAGVIFGIIALAYPGSALIALAILFGAYAFVDGIFALAAAFTGIAGTRWWALLLEGILGLVVAFVIWTQPVFSTAVLVYAVAIWAIITGVIEIIAGFQLRDVINNEWLYILAGVVSIIFGILVFRDIDAGAIAIAWTIGIYAILFGIMQLGVAFRLNGLRKAATA